MEKGAMLGRGRTADVYAWGEDRILKLYQTFMQNSAVESEFQITQAARNAGLAVPDAQELVEVDGRCGIVFERIQGTSMLKMLSAQPWKVVSMARQLADLHAQVHACQMPPGLPTQHAQIQWAIQFAPQHVQAAAQARLQQLPEGSCLCHGDFHPDNILISARGPVIIDWMTGTRGSALGDVGRTTMIFQTSGMPEGMAPPMRLLINVTRSLIWKTYLKRSLQLHGAAPQQIDDWQLPLMAARLREVEQYPAESRLLLAKINANLN